MLSEHIRNRTYQDHYYSLNVKLTTGTTVTETSFVGTENNETGSCRLNTKSYTVTGH